MPEAPAADPMKEWVFSNRRQAGRLLAEALLSGYAGRDDLIVLGLPRGGAVVAYEVAMLLDAPLDVMVVRKLGVPGWEELAMGAIASGGVRVINEAVMRQSQVSAKQLERVVDEESAELRRRELAYRGSCQPLVVANKTVLLIDDGIATGSTIRAAVGALRLLGPARLVVAVPTAAEDACEMLEPLVDELVALVRSSHFHAVGQWYEDFTQTNDDELRRLLAHARARHPQGEADSAPPMPMKSQ